MKYVSFLFLALLLSCQDNEPKPTSCRITKLGSEDSWRYKFSYNAAGKLALIAEEIFGDSLIYDNGRLIRHKRFFLPKGGGWDGVYYYTGSNADSVAYTSNLGTVKQYTLSFKHEDGRLKELRYREYWSKNVEIRKYSYTNDNVTSIQSKRFFGSSKDNDSTNSYTAFEYDTLNNPFYNTVARFYFYDYDFQQAHSKNNVLKIIDEYVRYENGQQIDEGESERSYSLKYNSLGYPTLYNPPYFNVVYDCE